MILSNSNSKVVRLIHGSILFIEGGEHFGINIKCPLENKKLKVAEIGVYKGINSKDIMKYLDVEKLYLIDPYLKYSKTYMGEQNWSEAEMIARRKMKKYGDKVVFIKKSSSEAINDIPNNMDYIYIDGNHNYEYVKSDIENYYKKLKPQGILAGHDIEIFDVLRAVMEFTKENNLSFFITKEDWIIIK